MVSLLQGWAGRVEVDGKEYASIHDLKRGVFGVGKDFRIKLLPNAQRREKVAILDAQAKTVYRVQVRQYMTKKASPGFGFMAKWNNDVPMPLCVMVGTIEKETPGMVYMKLHGDITYRVSMTCMCCGRPITNPVSQYFGIGPVCGGHNYVNPFDTEEELRNAVDSYRMKLKDITWEGWIIKSAILSKEEYDENNRQEAEE